MSLTALERRQIRALVGEQADNAPLLEVPEVQDRPAEKLPDQVVLVAGAHPWAGASAVALALADEASIRRDGVLLVDASPHESSGLIAVTERELGVRRDGWSAGRRGALEVLRGAGQTGTGEIRPPAAAGGVVVVDTGGRATDLLTWGDRPRLVLACRATIPGIRAAEIALHRLSTAEVVIAAVGARRLDRAVRATAGRHVTGALVEDRVVCFEHHRRLAVEGLDDRPLSRSHLSSAAKVWAALDACRTNSSNGGNR